MQDLVIANAAETSIAGLFITHDLAEAARIADRIAVMHTHGRGILGERPPLPARPGARSDDEVFAWVQAALRSDPPLFAHIHDVDERAIA